MTARWVCMGGVLFVDGTGRFTNPVGGGRSSMAFGAANSTGTGEAQWQMVRLYNPSAAIHPLS